MNRNFLRDQNVGVLPQIGQYPVDFLVRQMLEHLANQTKFRIRQPVGRDVSMQELNPPILECIPVMLDELRYDIDTQIANVACLGDSSSDREISTSQVDNALNAMLLHELSHESAVLVRRETIRTNSGGKPPSPADPCVGTVNALECLL